MKGDYMEMADSITLTMNTEPIVTIDDTTFGETTLKHVDYKFGEDKYLKELK